MSKIETKPRLEFKHSRVNCKFTKFPGEIGVRLGDCSVTKDESDGCTTEAC